MCLSTIIRTRIFHVSIYPVSLYYLSIDLCLPIVYVHESFICLSTLCLFTIYVYLPVSANLVSFYHVSIYYYTCTSLSHVYQPCIYLLSTCVCQSCVVLPCVYLLVYTHVSIYPVFICDASIYQYTPTYTYKMKKRNIHLTK